MRICQAKSSQKHLDKFVDVNYNIDRLYRKGVKRVDDICRKLDRIAAALEAIASGLDKIAEKCPDCSHKPEQKINVHIDPFISDRSDD